MALKELLTDLSKFKYTNYKNVGANNSPIEGRHSGINPGENHLDPTHPEAHSKFDDGAGENLSQIRKAASKTFMTVAIPFIKYSSKNDIVKKALELVEIGADSIH